MCTPSHPCGDMAASMNIINLDPDVLDLIANYIRKDDLMVFALSTKAFLHPAVAKNGGHMRWETGAIASMSRLEWTIGLLDAADFGRKIYTKKYWFKAAKRDGKSEMAAFLQEMWENDTLVELERRHLLERNSTEEHAISRCFNELLIPAFMQHATVDQGTRQNYTSMMFPSETRKNGTRIAVLNWFDPTHTSFSAIPKMFYRIEHFPTCYEDMQPGGICYEYIGSANVGKQSISDGRHYLKWFFRAVAMDNDPNLRLPIPMKDDNPSKGLFPAEAYNLRAMIERYMPGGAGAP